MSETFYVTTPIYYANSQPHLGSLYTTLVADCLRRHKRQLGLETLFLTGTDEHGINIQRIAAQNGITPREHVDRIANDFQRMFAKFELDTASGGYDIFMRTSSPDHYQGVSAIWESLAKAKTPLGNDAIYKGFYEGWFCPACASFKSEEEYSLPEREGDPPLCLEHLRPLDRVSEESYFFRLSDYADALLDLYKARPDFIRPESRRNEVVSFVSGSLQDLSISRQTSSVSWAIPVPGDPSQTIYVWFDALCNYITGVGYGSDDDKRRAYFKKFWPALHLVGKDILRFHAVYWPAFLIAAGIEVPKTVFAHGMWLDPAGRKMSKTLGNTIDLEILHRHFPIDYIRYFCLREMVFGQDGRFGYETLIDRVNSDLANGIGNLASRTLSMISRYCDGLIPDERIDDSHYLNAKRVGIDPDAIGIVSHLELTRDQFLAHFEQFEFSKALEVAWALIAKLDKMISEAKPWDLAKDPDQKQTVSALLYRSAEGLRWLSVLLAPVMPQSMKQLSEQLGLAPESGEVDPRSLKWGGLEPGLKLGTVKGIFPRMDKSKLMVEIGSEASGTASQVESTDTPAPTHSSREVKSADQQVQPASAEPSEAGRVVSFIEIDDFAKVDLRVGQILTAERIPKSDKLLKLMVDIGEQQPRQVLAGIAEYYEPDSIVGRKIVVVSNLKPRKMRGLESQGMIVAASVGDSGRPVLATFTEDVPNGARLK